MHNTWGHRVKLPVKKEREWGPKVESFKVGAYGFAHSLFTGEFKT